MPEEEPKIIVDSDWKEQVAKEKEADAAGKGQARPPEATGSAEETRPPEADAPASAAAQPTAQERATGNTDVSPPPEASAERQPTADSGAADDALPPPPPASFEMLLSMLFTQAMGMLGQIPDPSTGKTRVDKAYAKHTIDTLEMLGEKTKGNLDDSESKMLSEALHALRMAYVSAKG